jgi:hypothetical protein
VVAALKLVSSRAVHETKRELFKLQVSEAADHRQKAAAFLTEMEPEEGGS